MNSLSREGCAVNQFTDPIELGGYRQAFCVLFHLYSHSPLFHSLFGTPTFNAIEAHALLVEYLSTHPKNSKSPTGADSHFSDSCHQACAKSQTTRPNEQQNHILHFAKCKRHFDGCQFFFVFFRKICSSCLGRGFSPGIVSKGSGSAQPTARAFLVLLCFYRSVKRDGRKEHS